MTVPGVGPITAWPSGRRSTSRARFRRSRSVGAYIGLTPRRYASGEVDGAGGSPNAAMPCSGAYLFEGRAAHPGAAMVQAQGLGSPAVETHRLQEGQDRRGPEAGGHPASHVARWNRLHLVKQGGGKLRGNNVQEFRESGTDVPVGTAASARSTQALRCLIEASAIHTLIRQRPPTPSCRGHSPYCGENSEPDRYITESLTSNPRVREQPGSRALT